MFVQKIAFDGIGCLGRIVKCRRIVASYLAAAVKTGVVFGIVVRPFDTSLVRVM